MKPSTITKELSANDTGETGGHQAGILVPKRPELLGFFPRLDPDTYNPRVHLNFSDDAGVCWEFAFIYYNNARFGGTRDEYRLTRMTSYIRTAGLLSGDSIELRRDEDENYTISFRRSGPASLNERGALVLGSGWRVISI